MEQSFSRVLLSIQRSLFTSWFRQLQALFPMWGQEEGKHINLLGRPHGRLRTSGQLFVGHGSQTLCVPLFTQRLPHWVKEALKTHVIRLHRLVSCTVWTAHYMCRRQAGMNEKHISVLFLHLCSSHVCLLGLWISLCSVVNGPLLCGL